MRIDVMRRIDRWVGNPLCRLLAPLSRLFEKRPEDDTVVLSKYLGIGSLVLTHPLVQELKGRGCRVVFLSFEANRDVLERFGADQVLTVDPKSPVSFLLGTWRCIRQLRRMRPKAFLNLEFFSRYSALIGLFSGAPLRSGFHMIHLPIGRLYSRRSNFNVYEPVFANFLNIGRIGGLVGETGHLEDYIRDFGPFFDGLTAPKLDGPYIVINTETSQSDAHLREWPADNWCRLLGDLAHAFPGRKLVLDGTERSRVTADTIKAAAGDVPLVDMVGVNSILDLAALIAGAELVITVDSAPAHLSAFAATPTVVLYGPETPQLFGYRLPWVQTLFKGLFCSPCLAIYDAKESVLDCRDNQCMKQITVAEVVAAAKDLLSGPGAARGVVAGE